MPAKKGWDKAKSSGRLAKSIMAVGEQLTRRDRRIVISYLASLEVISDSADERAARILKARKKR